MTTTAAAKLVSRGLLELDTPIAYWLPDLPPHHRATTLRQLLTHRGGVRHYLPKDFDPKQPGGPVFTRGSWTNAEILAAFGDDDPVPCEGDVSCLEDKRERLLLHVETREPAGGQRGRVLQRAGVGDVRLCPFPVHGEILRLAAHAVETRRNRGAPGRCLSMKATTKRLTKAQIEEFLPADGARGAFTFPAPYNTTGIRLTNDADCADGADCLWYAGYSYWRNINNHVGSDTMLIFLGLDRQRGGGGPTLFSYNKVTGATINGKGIGNVVPD